MEKAAVRCGAVHAHVRRLAIHAWSSPCSLCRTATACTLWEAHLEELLPYLLANVGVLDALSAAVQAQREAEAAAAEASCAAAAAELAALQAAVAAGGAAGSFAGVATVTADGPQWLRVKVEGSSEAAAAAAVAEADGVAPAAAAAAPAPAPAGLYRTPGAASLGVSLLPTGSGATEMPPACALDAGAPATKGNQRGSMWHACLGGGRALAGQAAPVKRCTSICRPNLPRPCTCSRPRRRDVPAAW